MIVLGTVLYAVTGSQKVYLNCSTVPGIAVDNPPGFYQRNKHTVYCTKITNLYTYDHPST